MGRYIVTHTHTRCRIDTLAMRASVVVGALASIAAAVHGAAIEGPSTDAVVELPGWGTPPAPQWSGFLPGDADGVMLHYWFASAEVADPSTAPVVLWLNGGPGSSSILGMLQEHGPLLVNNSGALIRNPYAWTKIANLLILENPAGVGYSYCTNNGQPSTNCSNTDIKTAAAARSAVAHFFGSKFPSLAKNDFVITGESYAGVYVPTLAKEIVVNAPQVNLVAIAVGDPCTDNTAQRDSMDMLWYGHKNGFVPDAEYDFLWNNCSSRFPVDLARGVWGAAAVESARRRKSSDDPACVLANRKFQAQTSRGFSQDWSLAWINDLTLYGPAAVVPFTQPGSLNYLCAQYMMQDSVKAALHLESSPATSWPGPGAGWSYRSDYDACNGDVPQGAPSMIEFYAFLAPHLKKTYVYNGDTDPCVSYEGTRTAIERVGFAEKPGGSYRPWFFNAERATTEFLVEKPLLFGPDLAAIDAGAQFAGHVVSYEHDLSFLTVHGSGHMVPQFRPQAALRMLQTVLSTDLLAPLFESDDALSKMSDAEYSTYLDSWTVKAKGMVAPQKTVV